MLTFILVTLSNFYEFEENGNDDESAENVHGNDAGRALNTFWPRIPFVYKTGFPSPGPRPILGGPSFTGFIAQVFFVFTFNMQSSLAFNRYPISKNKRTI